MEQTQTVKTQPATEKIAYEAPKADFIPMQVEERLLTCSKAGGAVCEFGPQNS